MAKTALQKHIDTLVSTHGSLRAASRKCGVDLGYLWKMRKGIKSAPSDKVLKKLGLLRVETLKPV